MALSFSAEAYQKLWESSPVQAVDSTDWIQPCPAELGQGQRRWIQLRQGILLLIHDYELREDVWIGGDEPRENYPWLEFGFRLSGLCTGDKGDVQGADELFLCVNGLSEGMAQRLAGQRTLQVDIHFTEPSLVLDFLTDRLDRLPSDIQQMFGAIAAHEAQVQQAREVFASVAATHPQVLLLGAKDVNESIGVIEPESYLGELFEGLGFELIEVPTQANTADISVEVLPQVAADADTIFILGHDLSAGDEAQKASATPALDRALDRQTARAEQTWEESAIAQSLPASQQNRVFFTTYYLWNGLNGPIGAELVVEQLQQFLLPNSKTS